MGSVIGLAVVTPIMLVRSRRAETAFQTSRILRAQMLSVFGGTLVGLGMCSWKVASWENRPQKFQDRAYRIHYNRGQVRTDQFAMAGMAIGGAAGMGLWGVGLAPVIAGSSYAIVIAMLAHLATVPKE